MNLEERFDYYVPTRGIFSNRIIALDTIKCPCLFKKHDEIFYDADKKISGLSYEGTSSSSIEIFFLFQPNLPWPPSIFITDLKYLCSWCSCCKWPSSLGSPSWLLCWYSWHWRTTIQRPPRSLVRLSYHAVPPFHWQAPLPMVPLIEYNGS